MAATTTFAYSVRDRSGKLISGTLEAESQAAVANRLKGMGYSPVSIDENNKAGLKTEIKLPSLGSKVKLKDLAIFSRQFATMVNSGLSLLRALTILTEQTENQFLAGVIGEVRNDVETGVALSVAMGKHPKVFPPLMVNLTKAGEVGGFLDSVMLQVAANYEAEVKLRGKIKAAMTYPTVVFCIAILAVTGMLLFIVPTFAGLFKTLGGTLPAPTRVLVMLSHLLKFGMPFLVIGMIGSLIVWQRIKHTEKVRNFVDPMKL
jgi:type IV pilus assembly protein PilC